MISVIIPTLDEEQYLSGLLHDLARQSFQDFEVLIIDASKNGHTIDVAKQSTLKKIKIIKSSKANTAYQRNLGAKHASGFLLVFLDADIRLPHRNFLSAIYHKMPGAAGGRTNIRVLRSEETVLDYLLLSTANVLVHCANMIGFTQARGGCHVIKQSIFPSYNEHLRIGEDNECMQRVAKKGKVIYLGMTVFESPRRYRKEGYILVACRALCNGIYKIFTKKSFQEYKPIR